MLAKSLIHPRVALLVFGIISPATLAHSGPHLDEETLEAIFQFMDRVYQGFLTHLPLIVGIAVGLLVLLLAIKAIRTRRG